MKISRNFPRFLGFHVSDGVIPVHFIHMKHTKTLITCLAALAFTAPILRAEGDGGEEKEKDRPRREGFNKERILNKFDTNKDGALSKDELTAMPERMRNHLLEKWDANKDGELSKEEVDAIKPPADGGERRKERREREEKKEKEKEVEKE